MADATLPKFLEYLTVEKGLSPLTIGAYRADLAELCQFLGDRQPVTAQHHDLRDFIGKPFRTGSKPDPCAASFLLPRVF